MASYRVYEHPTQGVQLVIGRKSDCDIVIDEPYISGWHAKIEWRSNHFFLTDIASTNGTLLNGKPISSETWISETDSVQLGEVTLRIAEQR
jgi:pSer/pThr/pTyr-binding forkhead associated (FHA) protein